MNTNISAIAYVVYSTLCEIGKPSGSEKLDIELLYNGYDLSRRTIQRRLSELENAGLVYRPSQRSGAGTLWAITERKTEYER
jgi:repressor of nif and glnA expression